MRSVLSTLVRGLLGVVVTLGIVAILWTLYLKRDAVLAASEPVIDQVLAHRPDAQNTATSGSEADAPVVSSALEPRSAASEEASTDSPAVVPVPSGGDSDTGPGKQ